MSVKSLFGLVRHRKMSEYSLKIKSVGKFVYGAKKFFHSFFTHFIVLNRKAETGHTGIEFDVDFKSVPFFRQANRIYPLYNHRKTLSA